MGELVKLSIGVRNSFQHLWREIFYNVDLFRQAPRIQVPVYFFVGRHDSVVTADVAQRYFGILDAPQGKQLIWFENSGHWPHFTESEKYREVLVNKVLKETSPSSSSPTSR